MLCINAFLCLPSVSHIECKFQEDRNIVCFVHGSILFKKSMWHLGFLGGSVVKNPPAMQETQVQSLFQEDPLEKEMATHASIPAWEIPWTEKPGRVPSMGPQKSWTRLRDYTTTICNSDKFSSHAAAASLRTTTLRTFVKRSCMTFSWKQFSSFDW